MKTDVAILIVIIMALIALVTGLSLRAEPQLEEINVRHIWSTDCEHGDWTYQCVDRKEIVYD